MGLAMDCMGLAMDCTMLACDCIGLTIDCRVDCIGLDCMGEVAMACIGLAMGWRVDCMGRAERLIPATADMFATNYH
jgi:hypothetical protein